MDEGIMGEWEFENARVGRLEDVEWGSNWEKCKTWEDHLM
jgi:hypothetical protein